jgi:hypothetical protein
VCWRTWQSPPGLVKGAVCHALKVGYHHIDCAPVYGNQKEVGEGLKEGLQKNGMQQSKFFALSESVSSYVSQKLALYTYKWEKHLLRQNVSMFGSLRNYGTLNIVLNEFEKHVNKLLLYASSERTHTHTYRHKNISKTKFETHK